MNKTQVKKSKDLLTSTNGDASENGFETDGLASGNDHQSAAEAEIVESTEQPASKNRKKAFYIAGAVLIVAAIAGTIYWLYARQFEYTDDAFISGDVVQISPKITAYVTKVAVKDNQLVKKGDLLIELNEEDMQVRLEQAKSQLQAAQAGRLKSEARTDLTRKTTNAAMMQARSNVRTARNNVTESGLTAEAKQAEILQSESALKTAKANLAQTKAQIPQAESNLRLAQTEHERNLSLYKYGSVSRQSLDKTENAVERARAELSTAQNQVAAAESRVSEAEARVITAQTNYKQSLARVESTQSEVDESLGRLRDAAAAPERVAVDQSDIQTADAEIEKAEAAIRQAELELSYTKIYAPEDGYVTSKNVQEGQLVQPGKTLMAISQTDVWVVANFKETQLERIRVGQTVDIKVDAFPGKTFRGRVESFQAGTGSAFSLLPAENASGNFVKVVQRVPVKIIIEEKPDDIYLLVPGMSVQPRVRVL